MKRIIFIVLTISMFLIFMGSGSRKLTGPNRAPVANAGMDRNVQRFNTIFLDGSKSYDPDGDKLYYKWELLAAPQNIPPRVFGGQLGMKTCRFRSDVLGTYVLALTVCDGKLFSQRDVMQIHVQNPPGDPHTPYSEEDVYIPEVVKLGQANLRPAPDGSKFVIATDKFRMYVAFKNPFELLKQIKVAFIYDWTPIKADGKNKKLWESIMNLQPGENRAAIYGYFNSPKKKESKTLAIRREHTKGYDILYTVQVKADR